MSCGAAVSSTMPRAPRDVADLMQHIRPELRHHRGFIGQLDQMRVQVISHRPFRSLLLLSG